MHKKNITTFHITYTVTILFITAVCIFIAMSFYDEYKAVLVEEEKAIFSKLLQQSNHVDKQMAEIFDRSRLQELWIEEVSEEELHKINLVDYTWTYKADYNVTMLETANEDYGSIFIHGPIENLDSTAIAELKRILASFKIQKFMLDHVTFFTWNIYYTDWDIIATYPSVPIDELFDLNEMSTSDLYDYVQQNMSALKTEGTAEDLKNGWESNLNYDIYGQDVIFTRNWPTVIDGQIHGILQSGFELDPLKNIITMPHENSSIYIVDPANNIVYDNGQPALELNTLELIDLNNLQSYSQNPYGKGLYKRENHTLTFILDSETTNWKLIYQQEQNTFGLHHKKIVFQYFIYLCFTLIVGSILFRYIRDAYKRRKQADAEMLYKLQYDHLTGALNKNMLQTKLQQMIEDAKTIPFSIAMLDIDDFKHVNDTYGHGFGDKVLIQVAKTIRQSLRATDTVCRFGGEEFILLLTNADTKLATDICKRILHNVQRDTKEHLDINLTVSIGLAMYTEDHTSETIIETADTNLYKAKELGKNQVIFM